MKGHLRIEDYALDFIPDCLRRVQLPVPGGYTKQFVKDLLRRNALYEGALEIGGQRVDPSKITVPLLSRVAQYDHIVPPECARPSTSAWTRPTGRSGAARRARQPGDGAQRRQTHVIQTGSMDGESIYMSNDMKQRYPRTVTLNGATFEIARMAPGDGPEIGAFVATLVPHDLLFLSKDVTHPKVISAWADAVGEGRVHSLVARDASGKVVGCTAIVTEDMTWSRHVGELRVLLGQRSARQGLGGHAGAGVLRARAEPGAGKALRAHDHRPAHGHRGV